MKLNTRHRRRALAVLAAVALLLGLAPLAAAPVRADPGPWVTPWLIVVNNHGGEDNSPDGKAPATIHTVNTSTDTVYGPFLADQLGRPVDPVKEPEYLEEIVWDGGGLFDVVITPDCSTALVSDFGDSMMFFIDVSDPTAPSLLASVEISGTWDLGPAEDPRYVQRSMFAEDIALTQDGRFAVVADGGFSSGLVSLDVAKRTLVDLLDLWDRSDPENLPHWYAQAVAIAPDGTVVIVDYFGGRVNTLTIDGSGHLTPVATYDLPLETVDGDPYIERPVNVAIAPDGQTVLIGSCQVDWVSVYRITGPGILTYVGKVSGLPPLWDDMTVSWRGSQQSLTFSGDGTQAYVVTNGRDSGDPEYAELPNQVSVLDILGPGNVALHTSGAATMPNHTGSQLFGVDTIAAASGKLYVSNQTTGGAVDYLSVVNLNTFGVSMLAAGPLPMGVATCALGRLIVEKQTIPDGAAGSFSFSGAAQGAIGDGGQIVAEVAAGSYVVSEADPGPDFELVDITCDDSDSRGDLPTRTATFNLLPGETVKCTFTNRLQTGAIVVEKQTDPDGAAGSFTFSGDAAGTVSDDGTIVVSDLLPGVYTSTEADPGPGFELQSIVCDDGNSSGDVGTRTATFVLDPNETVTCTFVNAQRAVRVSKEPLWPVGGLAGLGQEIRYLITVENAGGVTVDPLTLRDEYDPWCLKSRKAEVPPDVHGGTAGFLQWNNLGALAPGETVTLWVEFTANHACDPATNTAIVETDGLSFRDEATVRILETVAFVGGRVFHDESGVGTHMAEYRGVEGAQVSLDSLLYTTNTSGWYSFNLLDPGTYTVLSAPPASSWWVPTTSETCAATIVNTWDQVFCNFGYWWGLDGPPVDGLVAEQKVTLGPLQDATISGPEPGNHGAEETLWVRQPGLSSTLVQFDVSGLPAGVEVVWAKLRLYGFTASNPDNRLYLTAYPLSKMWTEGGATWSEAASAVPWDGAGAVGAGDHGAPVGWAWTNTPGWVTFDLDPAVVAAWLADPGGNYGLLLRGEGTINRKVAYWFLSKEHGNGAAHPQLVIGYNLP